jgi:hypothetical protein
MLEDESRKAVVKKKQYNLITIPALKECWVENYGDRQFQLHRSDSGAVTYSTVTISGDTHWDITEENIKQGAEYLLNKELDERNKKSQKSSPQKNDSEVTGSDRSVFEKVFGKGGLFEQIFGKNDHAQTDRK